MVKRLPTVRETRVQSLDREDLLEKAMATHSSTLAWKIPWKEEEEPPGEGNGNPHQYSCLENPMDGGGGAW